MIHKKYNTNWKGFNLFQHVVLAIKFAVAYAIPDIPEWVETEIAKVEFQRRQALKVKQRACSDYVHSTLIPHLTMNANNFSGVSIQHLV